MKLKFAIVGGRVLSYKLHLDLTVTARRGDYREAFERSKMSTNDACIIAKHAKKNKGEMRF